MRILVEISEPTRPPRREWVIPGDGVRFKHTAQIHLADGSTVSAGPPRVFMVTVLAAQADEILDSEYIPPDERTRPWLAAAWDRLVGANEGRRP